MADETRRQEPARPPVAPIGSAGDRTATGQRDPLVRLDDGREAGGGGRLSPRMRFDVLQLAAWATGLYLVIAGAVALARTGFEDLGAFEPVVEVGTETFTPLYAVLWLLLGVMLLAAGTGTVQERGLRIGGVLFGVAGAVILLEPAPFGTWLGVDPDSGTVLLAIGALLTAASFVPPLSVTRPGVRGG